jgi:putative ABC transport system substrate-binding protein
MMVVVFAIAFSLYGAVAEAQQTGKVPRVGFLDVTTTAASGVLMEAFRQEMRKLGWIEGKNFTIDSRFAEGKFDHSPVLRRIWFVSK